MFYFTCNESKIYESFTFWNKLQEKMNFFHDILIYWDAPVYLYIILYYLCPVLLLCFLLHCGASVTISNSSYV